MNVWAFRWVVTDFPVFSEKGMFAALPHSRRQAIHLTEIMVGKAFENSQKE